MSLVPLDFSHKKYIGSAKKPGDVKLLGPNGPQCEPSPIEFNDEEYFYLHCDTL